MRWRGGLLLGLVLFTGIACAGTREVYVWQRQFGPEIAASLNTLQPVIDGACVLAAEVSWTGGRMRVVRPTLDYAPLIALKKPIGLALRIGAFAGPFAADDDTARALGEIAAEFIHRAQTAGLTVAEIQIDFDAAESKLAGYREWLGGWRRHIGRTPLVFTALPAWLRHAEFRALAQTADGFVLQVHSLERPAGIAANFSLCDPDRAAAWARQAGEAGVPFRIALPTYGYVLGFDPRGKFLALVAEGPRPVWPKGTQVRVVRADAPALARFAQTLTAAPPPHCTGVIWYRLPVASDRLNWDVITLETVLRGELPAKSLRAEVVWAEPGLAEISIINRGQTTEPLPPEVKIAWAGGERVVASDGLAGFFLEMHRGEAQAIVRAADVPVDAFLAPGRHAKIAWLRFAHEISLEVLLPAPP
ncbi:MAG TPA: DUF3142 domain-containing protein [Opitutaceae bacterium]|nr:DUF3142 domain-containing protein [Opitutaceae bacterium]